MAELHHADPGARRRLALMLVVVAAVGVAAHFGLEAWLETVRALPRARAVESVSSALHAGSLAVSVAVLLVAVHFWRFGRRVKAGGRFPPVGAKTVREIRVLTGAAARRRGQVLQALSVLLTLAAVGQYALLLGILSRLAGTAA